MRPSSPLSPRAVARASTLAAVAALAACGDTSVEPGVVGPASQFRRLVVADSGNFARVFEAESGARVDSMGGLPGRVTYLYTAMGRVAAAHFQTQDRVAFIDAGVYEQGGRGVRAAPRIVGTHTDVTPIHGNSNGTLLSAHFDGSGNVSFWDETAVAAGSVAPMLTVTTGTAHHGAGVALTSDFVSASVRSATGTSPDGVVVFNRQGQRVDSTRTCPGLHGLAANQAGVLYGCADGALHVRMDGASARFTKLTRTDDARFGVGTVWARQGQPNFLVRMSIRGQPASAATRALGVADVAGGQLRAIALPNNDLDWTAEVDWSGGRAVVIGYSGTLYVVDLATRQVTGQLANFVPARPTSGTVLDPYIGVAAGVAYVTSPTQGRVYEVSLGAQPAVARTMAVGGTPMRIAVMGVREDRRLQAAAPALAAR